jgi:N-acetylmuramic acid 6-phosphate etherase
VLNMISTAAMIRLGYVKGNRMTNMKAANEKLKDRSLRILMAETGLGEVDAEELMRNAGDDLRVALVMNNGNVDRSQAEIVLKESHFVVEEAVRAIRSHKRML